jgi:hypothetical protein
MTLLVLKVLLAPAFVVGISLVARRFGARAAGIVGGLPVIAGPILLVVAIERGHAFAAAAARGTVLGVVPLIGFVLVYAAIARRSGWPLAVGGGWAAFFALVGVIRGVHVGSAPALALAVGACVAGAALLPNRPAAGVAAPLPRWDLPARAVCAVVPVVVITAAATTLGPRLTGILASFPILMPVVTAFTHAHSGEREAVRLLRGFTVGFVAYASFCFVVSVAVEGLGVAAAFLVASTTALAVQAVVVVASVGRPRLGLASGG